MAKNKRDTGFTNTSCNKCGAEAHTKSGSYHRRCSGSAPTEEGQTPMIREKHCALPKADRGKWQ